MTALKTGLRDGLAAYLQTQLVGTFPTLLSIGYWPQPGQQLVDPTIAVLAPGTPVVEYHAPLIESVVAGVTPAGTATYSYGNVSVGMQIDAWSKTESGRDLLVAAIDLVMNQPAAITLGVTTLFPVLGRDGGLVITIPELLGINFDFQFDATARLAEDSDAAQTNEWRATWTGTADGYLTTQEQVVLLQSIGIPITP